MWSIYTATAGWWAVSEAERMMETDINSMKTVTKGQEGYPSALGKLPDPPQKLHFFGNLGGGPTVALVGSRNADTGAIRFTFSLAESLAKQGVRVISGGALGIDTAAHKGALHGDGHTVAVLGAGFEFLYPSENKELFGEIAASGALVSEFDPPQPPTKWTFPKRNRIVAAWSDAVVVTQAKERSGALITAKIAMELGVPVGAVPGTPGDPRNRGAHGLLKRGAALVEDAADVFALMAKPMPATQPTLPGFGDEMKQPVSVMPDLSETETKILNFLSTRPLHIDEISHGLGLMPRETGAVILALELQGLVEDRGGKNFVRVG